MKIKEKFISTTVKKGLDLLAEISKRGYEAYIAGGAVRDLAMLQMGMAEASHVHDVDIATNMPIEELKLAFRCDSNNGEKHGTILVHYDDTVFEVTQFRVDGDYSDGRHRDSVSFTKCVKED
jgi:tRNA nucleotidyltransferase (CCA-adding enzyme)